MKIIHFYHFDSDPGFPSFLLYVRWKSGVTFVRRCFRDGGYMYLCRHSSFYPICMSMLLNFRHLFLLSSYFIHVQILNNYMECSGSATIE